MRPSCLCAHHLLHICPLFDTKPRSHGSASQEERINMLNVALIEKGVIASGGHYELKQTPPVADAQPSPASRLNPLMDELNEDGEGGVVL